MKSKNRIDLLSSIKITRQKVEYRSDNIFYCSDRFYLIFGEEVISFNAYLN